MSRWNQAREKNRSMAVKNAERVLADTSYDRFRSSRALLGLVIADAVTTAAIPIAWWGGGAIPGLLATIVWGGVFLLLRVAVRSQADLPDDVLDERMRAERDRVYVGAYRLVASVVFIGANAALVAVAFGDENTRITFDYESVSAVYWTVFAVLLAAPSLVLALDIRANRPD